MKTMHVMVALVAGAAASVANAQDLRLNLLRSIDVSGAGIGNGPASVAWNGTDVYVGGLNNTGSAANAALVRVADALGSASIGAAFGATSASAFAGYEYLDINGNQLFASSTGTATNTVASFDGTSGAALWNLGAQTNPVEGVAFDRRFGGRVAHLQFGRGFAFLDNPDGTARGDVGIFNGAVGTAFRGADIDFNGNLFVRTANGTFRYSTSDGTPNSGTWNATTVTNLGAAGTAQGLNVQALDNTGFGDFVIMNNRGNGSLESLLRVTDYSGNAVSFSVNGTIDTSITGWYSFSYDRGTNTLAVADLSNEQVYIFAVVPTPASAALLGLGGLAAARRRRA